MVAFLNSLGLGRPFPAPAAFPRPLSADRPAAREMLRALRPRHWVKNLLVFAPLLFSEGPPSAASLERLALVFAGFCLLSSAGYVLNDLRDRPFDRLHPVKRNRPLARGGITAGQALPLIGALGAVGLVVFGCLVPRAFVVAGAYLMLSGVYTFFLKRGRWADVVALAGLLSLRAGAGVAALAVGPDPRGVAFIFFLTLSLACAKRLMENRDFLGAGPSALTPYRAADAPRLVRLGAGAACLALAAFAAGVPGHRPMSANAVLAGIAAGGLLAWGLVRFWRGVAEDRLGRDILQFFLGDATTHGLSLVFLLCSLWSHF